MPTNQKEIPVACPVCKGHALLNITDRSVECFKESTRERPNGHRFVFLPSYKFDTLFELGYLPA